VHFRYRIVLLDFELDFHRVGTYLLYLSLIMSVWSAGEYIRFFVQAAEEKARRAREESSTDPTAARRGT